MVYRCEEGWGAGKFWQILLAQINALALDDFIWLNTSCKRRRDSRGVIVSRFQCKIQTYGRDSMMIDYYSSHPCVLRARRHGVERLLLLCLSTYCDFLDLMVGQVRASRVGEANLGLAPCN